MFRADPFRVKKAYDVSCHVFISLIIYKVKCETPARASPSGPRACSTQEPQRGNQIPIRDISTLEADAHFLLLIQISTRRFQDVQACTYRAENE